MKNSKNDNTYSYTLGITLTFELLIKKSDMAVCIYIHSKFLNANNYDKLIDLANEKNIEVIHSDKIFNILSQKENCFVIGKFKRYISRLENNNHLVLVNPSNAGNMGTIIRSMIGYGIHDLAIISPAVDIFDTKTIRASMGSIFQLNFQYYDSFDSYQNSFPNNEIYPFMLKAKNNLANTVFKTPCSLVFGNEATGLDDSYLRFKNTTIIKHTHDIDSLNLTIAASTALYELTKNNFKSC